ncbi:MAG: mycofactocin biosynthesis chaperone MftB [Actinophytocola sp.]|nr:mycofactocin biosynthesis chaperone MftB [Actinophytocola sp.]
MSTDTASDQMFDPALPYELAPSVSVRPEPFGALVYDFVSRRLSFLKTPLLVSVVRELAEQPDAHAALTAAEVPDKARSSYLDALAGLAAAGTIRRRHREETG